MLSMIVKCETCKHYILNDDKPYPTCRAFPDGIPGDIFDETIDHEKPYKDDNGIRYEKQ